MFFFKNNKNTCGKPEMPNGYRVRGAGGPSAEGPLRDGLADGAGPGPGPAHEGIDSYSAQEGINSNGNMI